MSILNRPGPSEAVRHGDGRRTKNLQGDREKEEKGGKKEKRGEKRKERERRGREKNVLRLYGHRRTGCCGVLAIATWAAWFWAAQGRLLTKKKEERKGKKKKGRRRKKRKGRKRREEREEDLRPIWAGISMFRLCTSLYTRPLLLQLGNRPQVDLHIMDIGQYRQAYRQHRPNYAANMNLLLFKYVHMSLSVKGWGCRGGCVWGWVGCWLCSECYLMWMQSVVRSKDVRCKVCVGVGVDVRGWRGEWWWVNLVYVWYMYEVYNV